MHTGCVYSQRVLSTGQHWSSPGLASCSCGSYQTCWQIGVNKVLMEHCQVHSLTCNPRTFFVAVVELNEKRKCQSLGCIPLFATPWTVSPPGSSVYGILQARILKCLPLSSPWNLPEPGVEAMVRALQVDILLSEPPGELSSGSKACLGHKDEIFTLDPYRVSLWPSCRKTTADSRCESEGEISLGQFVGKGKQEKIYPLYRNHKGNQTAYPSKNKSFS